MNTLSMMILIFCAGLSHQCASSPTLPRTTRKPLPKTTQRVRRTTTFKAPVTITKSPVTTTLPPVTTTTVTATTTIPCDPTLICEAGDAINNYLYVEIQQIALDGGFIENIACVNGELTATLNCPAGTEKSIVPASIHPPTLIPSGKLKCIAPNKWAALKEDNTWTPAFDSFGCLI